MKIKSIAGLGLYVKDLNKTVEFYTKLGFDFKKSDQYHATGYINWAWIDFISAEFEDKPNFIDEAKLDNKGGGVYINLSVEDVNQTHKDLLEMGIKPSTEPKTWPNGNREFVLRDPDGYKIVFFQKK